MQEKAPGNPLQPVVRDDAGRIALRRLTRHDAKAIAELEKLTYPPHLQAGSRQLRLDLDDAQWEDSHLGYGLFAGKALVGFMLVYYENDCRNLFSYFGMDCPSDISIEECLYVADFIVRREYSRYTLRLVKEVCANLGPSHERLPLYGFSTRAVLDQWQAGTSAARRAGLRYVGKRGFALPEPPHEVFLVRFEVQPPRRPADLKRLTVKPITTLAGWEALEGDWNALLQRTPEATAFQSYELQRIWWEHLRENGWPLILVAYQGEKVRAIAPLSILITQYFGISRRLLKFIGEHSEIDRPTVLRKGQDREAVAAIFNYVFEHREQWDSILLYEQPKDGLIVSTAVELCRSHPVLFGVVPGPLCPWVDLRGSWEDFLAEKSRNFRKNLKRRLKQLQARGEVTFNTYESWPELLQGFDIYLQVEARSWKPDKKLGVAKSRRYLNYHTALLYEYGPRRKFHLRTLSVDGKPIAATFGLLMDGRFLSLHIAHDKEYGECSPGVLLTAYELEEGYGRADYTAYEFLGGFLENKVEWTGNTRETQQLYVYQRDALFTVHYSWHFRLLPAIKRALRQLGVFTPLVRFRDAVRERLLRKRAQAADD